MAKELMEIGGFITEGAEIVNHDNSLSGNGTVDSPLGVVPGYNETVLFDDSDGQSTGTFSETIENFERIKVLYVWNSATDNKAKYVELQAVAQVFSYLDNGKAGTTYNWFGWGSWEITTTGFRLLNGYQDIGKLASTTPVSSGPRIYKVIGINRKA